LAIAAATLAQGSGRIVTLGIHPDRPATGFGYIRLGEPFEGQARFADGFVEKPDLARAKEYLASGAYVWNAGMFFMGVTVFLDAVQRHRPAWTPGLAGCLADDEGSGLSDFFAAVETVSVDVAIMEPEGDRLLVIPADVGWCDLGSWSALSEFANAGSNFVRGKARLVDVEDSVVVTEAARVTVMGLSGLCVVATDEEILVASLDRAEEVRKLAELDLGGD